MRKTRLLAILATGERSRGELASELGISSQPWLSRAYMSPLMAQGSIAQTLAQKPKSPLQRYRLTLFVIIIGTDRGLDVSVETPLGNCDWEFFHHDETEEAK